MFEQTSEYECSLLLGIETRNVSFVYIGHPLGENCVEKKRKKVLRGDKAVSYNKLFGFF